MATTLPFKNTHFPFNLIPRLLEKEWTRKYSRTVDSQNIYEKSKACSDNENQSWIKTKEAVKKVVKEDNQNYWKDKIKPLLIQGNLMKLLIEQEENITWESIIYSLPKGVMKFVINAAMDTLPTFTNLQRWGKRLNGRCPLCKNRGILHHILNNCTQALDRYTWRHDSILSVITNMLKKL